MGEREVVRMDKLWLGLNQMKNRRVYLGQRSRPKLKKKIKFITVCFFVVVCLFSGCLNLGSLYAIGLGWANEIDIKGELQNTFMFCRLCSKFECARKWISL